MTNNFREPGEFGEGATMVESKRVKPRLVKRWGFWRVEWQGRLHGSGDSPDNWWLAQLIEILPIYYPLSGLGPSTRQGGIGTALATTSKT
jgi:hypothetical protein